jgi:hypothetical protein
MLYLFGGIDYDPRYNAKLTGRAVQPMAASPAH